MQLQFSTIFDNVCQTGISNKNKIDIKNTLKTDIYAIGIFDHFRQVSTLNSFIIYVINLLNFLWLEHTIESMIFRVFPEKKIM